MTVNPGLSRIGYRIHVATLFVGYILFFVRTATAIDESLLCFCSDPHICPDQTCVRKHNAACFHSVQEAFNEDTALMETQHIFGCLPPPELDIKGGSELQCHGQLSPHQLPKSLACCFEGNYCNLNITPPPLNTTPEDGFSLSSILPLVFGCFVGFVSLSAIVILLVTYCFRRFLFDPKRNKWLVGKKGNNLFSQDIEAKRCLDDKKTLHEMIEASSGSDSGQMVQRAIALQHGSTLDIDFRAKIGAGRYGQVYKAKWRGDTVAVKVFFTTEEASWAREREIYLNCSMLGYKNILALYGTDYHHLGSLHDYLKSSEPITILEAVQFAQSAASGLTYLHEEIVCTRKCHTKPAIAHRDVKSKNILVKAPGVAIIADFGLAVKYYTVSGLDAGGPNTRVGTKRYMAPEVLNGSMNQRNFLAYKQADMYSFSLVIWEITRRIEVRSAPLFLATPLMLVSRHCRRSEGTLLHSPHLAHLK